MRAFKERCSYHIRGIPQTIVAPHRRQPRCRRPPTIQYYLLPTNLQPWLSLSTHLKHRIPLPPSALFSVRPSKIPPTRLCQSCSTRITRKPTHEATPWYRQIARAWRSRIRLGKELYFAVVGGGSRVSADNC